MNAVFLRLTVNWCACLLQVNDIVTDTAGALDNWSNDQEADGRKDGCNSTHSEEEIVVKMEEQDDEVSVKLEQEDQADELEEDADKNDSEGNEDEEMVIEAVKMTIMVVMMLLTPIGIRLLQVISSCQHLKMFSDPMLIQTLSLRSVSTLRLHQSWH